MSGSHTDIPPELRQLAQTIVDKLDPAVRLAAARVTAGRTGGCTQVWCPVCALVALVNGEQHPLLTVISEHSVALLDLVNAMAESATPPAGPPESPGPPGSPAEPGRYQHIPVTVTSTDD